ncbi:MAG: hypothetical protein M8354_04615 [Halalkalicoccus sp.]|nr:hypothetical protein [Halalkalicoccus sp.]
MTGIVERRSENTYIGRDSAPCKHCNEVIETDVPACPHCGNQPVAAVKWASIAAILVGTILAVPIGYAGWMAWFGPLVGVALFCGGVGVYWVVTDRYSPTKYDARTDSRDTEAEPTIP